MKRWILLLWLRSHSPENDIFLFYYIKSTQRGNVQRKQNLIGAQNIYPDKILKIKKPATR